VTETIREPGGPEAVAAGRVRLLGTVALIGPDGRTLAVRRPQLQLVLAHLLLAGRPVERGEVAELLWGDGPLSPHWKGALRGVLSKLRELFEESGVGVHVVVGADGTVRLERPPGLAVDVEEAVADVEAAERALEFGRGDEALAAVAGWAERLDGALLPAGDGDWVRSLQERAAALGRRAALVELRALLLTGRAAAAAERAAALVRRLPLDEAVHELRIRALLDDGRRAEAVEAHDHLVEVLARELGLRPAPSTSALLAAAPAAGPVPLLGRVAEVQAALAQVGVAHARSAPTFTLLTGPSGIGKTRVAEEVVAAARAAGVDIWWGRCLPGSGLPFEPLASAVRAAAAARGVEPTLVAALGAIVDGDGPVDDPDAARAHRFRTIARAVRALGDAPNLLVIDDLQWAPFDVVALLEHLLEEVEGPLAVVATGRNLPPVVHDALARIERSVPARTIALGGLGVDDLLPLFGDRSPSEALAAAGEVRRRTAGLPLFVRELAFAAERDGGRVDPSGLPEAVVDWVGHRVEALDRPVRACLEAAAVLDPDPSVGAIAALTGQGVPDVLDAVDLLVEQGFLVAGDQPGRCAFAHVITRDVVYDRTSPVRRTAMHVAAAEAARAAPPSPGQHATIARHLLASGPEHRLAAATASSGAGREALDQGAPALAEQLFAAAIDAAGDDPERRAEALVGLSIARHHQRDDGAAQDLLLEAIAVARAAGLPFVLGDAALALAGRAGRGVGVGLSDDVQAELLAEALAAVGELERAEPQPADREALVRRETMACQLEGELALAGLYRFPPEERAELAERAVARARRLSPPDPRLTARALVAARVAKLSGDRLVERLGDMDQVLALPGIGVEAQLTATTYRAEDLLRLGDRAGAQRGFERAAALAAHHQHAYWAWAAATWSGLDALIGGDLDRAEAVVSEALAMQGPQVEGAIACFGVNLVDLRLYQGRAGEVLDLLGTAAEANPHIPCYRAVLALAAAEAGDEPLARRCYDAFRADGFASVPDDSNRLLSFVVLADVAARFGDAEGGAVLAAELAPSRDHHALLNCYGGGGAYWGPVAHHLARLAAIDGRADDAAALFEQAERSAGAAGAILSLERIVADPLRP
jgi:DNA-binding SARP family transcriptional activator